MGFLFLVASLPVVEEIPGQHAQLLGLILLLGELFLNVGDGGGRMRIVQAACVPLDALGSLS